MTPVGFNRSLAALAVAALAACAVSTDAATARAEGAVGWSIHTLAEPAHFSSNDASRCEGSEEKCDRYQLLVMNVGDAPSTGPITVTDTLPEGITTLTTPVSGSGNEGGEWTCTEGAGNTSVTCTLEEGIAPGSYAPFIYIEVTAPGPSMSGALTNDASVTGGEAVNVAETSTQTPISSQPPIFGVDEFGMEADEAGGAASLQAGAHPWALTTSFSTPLVDSPPSVESGVFVPVENIKNIVVELPPGVVGDPTAAAQCTQTQLRSQACPEASRVGAIALTGGLVAGGEFDFTGEGCCSAVYNMVPEGGYPAEFAFTFATIPIYLYASVVHGPGGYHLRIASPGVPEQLEVSSVAVTFYGEPAALDGGSSTTAFLTNPTQCAGGALASRIGVESWEDPGHPSYKTATIYPQVTGCELLRFDAGLGVTPRGAPEGSSQSGAPSGYDVSISVPQKPAFEELATAEPKAVTVTLPVGVALSPSAAPGLVGCPATGPHGIDLPHGERAATEAGEGEAIGADGFSHLTEGHCPAASKIGEVEVETPLLASPLHGHLYLAQPTCGGEGQPACTEASATNGELYGLYLEVAGSGVVIKLRGAASANPVTGQVSASFAETPQIPFSTLTMHLKGGARAPLANPQTCGSFAATSDLEAWSAPITPDASPSSSPFAIGGCPSQTPFAPSFSAGTVTPDAGSSSPFTLTLARHDDEQDFAGVSVTTPPGVAAMLADVPPCDEAQANAGACSQASRIGTANVAAGAGSEPLWLSGGVYLTGPYGGAPFGLSIVVPAKAGPFNLGEEVVRAGIYIDRTSAAVTVASRSLPQILDGVPLRLQTINVTIDRPGFMLNPTNCDEQSISATVAGAQGATANVSSPFAVTGCARLSFKPSLTAATRARTSKVNGASLDVKIAYPGGGEANIRSVKVVLPKQLPSRLTTLQKACLAAVFAASPTRCPAESVVGVATAHTPVLPVALTGHVYLVSYGGEAFPAIVVVLEGDGVTVDLTGQTLIRKGITSSTFRDSPDVPVSSFELSLPQGRDSLLAANGNLCAKRLTMPTAITGQNGAVIKQNTRIAVTGCPKIKKKKAAR